MAVKNFKNLKSNMVIPEFSDHTTDLIILRQKKQKQTILNISL